MVQFSHSFTSLRTGTPSLIIVYNCCGLFCIYWFWLSWQFVILCQVVSDIIHSFLATGSSLTIFGTWCHAIFVCIMTFYFFLCTSIFLSSPCFIFPRFFLTWFLIYFAAMSGSAQCSSSGRGRLSARRAMSPVSSWACYVAGFQLGVLCRRFSIRLHTRLPRPCYTTERIYTLCVPLTYRLLGVALVVTCRSGIHDAVAGA